MTSSTYKLTIRLSEDMIRAMKDKGVNTLNISLAGERGKGCTINLEISDPSVHEGLYILGAGVAEDNPLAEKGSVTISLFPSIASSTSIPSEPPLEKKIEISRKIYAKIQGGGGEGDEDIDLAMMAQAISLGKPSLSTMEELPLPGSTALFAILKKLEGSKGLSLEGIKKKGISEEVISIAQSLVPIAKKTIISDGSKVVVSDDAILSLILITNKEVYEMVNGILTREGPIVEVIDSYEKMGSIICNIVEAIRSLDSYSIDGKSTYIPVELSKNMDSWSVGKQIILKGFTMALTDEKESLNLLDHKNPTLIEIVSKNGKRMPVTMSNHRAVIFRPHTHFLIKHISVSNGVKKFVLEETSGDVRGRKVCLWTDDEMETNNGTIVKEADKKGVTLSTFKSTTDTIKFIMENKNLLGRDTKSFRVITDMGRVESPYGKPDEPPIMDGEAGFKLINLLISLGCKCKILIYTSAQRMSLIRQRVAIMNVPGGVEITSDSTKCTRFSHFED